MVLKLYTNIVNPPARAALMVLDQLNLTAEFVVIDIVEKENLTKEFLKINPQHTIPVLIDDDFVLADSHAIAAYLVGKYAKDDSLYPKDLKQRAIVDQRLHFDTGVLFPAIKSSAAPVVYFGLKEITKEGQQKILEAYDFTDKFLTASWIAGEQLTIADICCVASISSLNEMIPIDAKTYPKLNAWFQKCMQLDIYKKNNAPGVKLFGEMVRNKLA